MKNKFIYFAVLAAMGLASCEPEFENEVSNASYSAGEADFSSYVAIGNSLTSGYMDGTVSRVGQQYSFPNILAHQFAVVGGGEFTQPSYEEDVNNLGGIAGIPGFPNRLVFNLAPKTDGNGNVIYDAAGKPVPQGVQPIAGTSTVTLIQQAKAYNNMGVPGAKTFHLTLQGYGNPANLSMQTANPYFVRFAMTPNSTVIGDAMTKNPTFFTNWIGNNDVLGYATNGGAGSTSGIGSADITPSAVFSASYNAIIAALTSGGAKGVVATIPAVTAIPFFTTVPYNPLTAAAVASAPDPTGAGAIQQLNTQLYGPLKQALTAFGAGDRINLLTATGKNPLLIKDETLTNLAPQLTAAFTPTLGPTLAAQYGQIFGQARQTTNNDLILLTTSSVIGTAPAGIPAPLNKYGVTYPLEDKHVLIPSEKTAIASATSDFNAIIRAAAQSKNLAVADMNAIMNQLAGGLRVEDGQVYTASYFDGTNANTVLFSLDGVHPNPRGYAIIANEVIKVINTHYNAKLPLVSGGTYPGITIVTTNQ
ncbi:SGNH/GDSL hydrolase family protein [Flavobacterium cerinum]|uniref:G-D-S-L family lipolytic protein n=1 Tax=Flavobacterium cerinum TaxID=2502784 RepID=A0ABY5IZJ4_9FLAO|nr:SGNH/GDSL hydrolase family protein [Flavobacterium cerinum]UUC46744.1 G-D-S-L family lipolytic protein [Flavobacterium cerinum]